MPAFGIDIPCLLTVHDLKYLLFPEFFKNYLKTFYYSWIIRRGTRKAIHIIAVSEATKNDLITLNISSKKITVIHEATTLSDTRSTLEDQLPDVLKDKSFLLFVGDNRPHKNIMRIVEAYRILLRKLGERCPFFVFAGPNFERLIKKCGSERVKKLIFLGPVYEEVLVSLYKHAVALVYPSLYEGFGLPILEAMSVGTPVITSNCSSMPEVAGSAALLIDPYNVEQLAGAILKIVTDGAERTRLRALGIQRVKQFSWAQTANSIFELYETIT
jgi:glycosyltransferase involved in cell wall biosynthesis